MDYYINCVDSTVKSERIDFSFSYPLVTILPKKCNVIKPNICSFATNLKKIYTYSQRDYTYIFRPLSDKNTEYYGYLSCIKILFEMCKNFSSSENHKEYDFVLNFRKLYEYKTRYDKCVQYYIDYFSLSIETNKTLINLMETSLLLSIKYFITKDLRYINKVKTMIDKIYNEEKLKLEELLEVTKKYIITH